MPRRSDHSRSEFIELVVDAAESIVAEAGQAALSARGIGKRIGYSAGSIYLAFENLDAVILHVNARTLNRMRDRMAAAIQAEGVVLERLRRAARAYVGFARENPHLWRLCFEHRIPIDQDTPEWLTRRIQELVQLVLDPLAEATELDGEALSEAAQALWAGVHGICILTLTNKMPLVGRQSTEKLTEALISNYLRGAAVPGD